MRDARNEDIMVSPLGSCNDLLLNDLRDQSFDMRRYESYRIGIEPAVWSHTYFRTVARIYETGEI